MSDNRPAVYFEDGRWIFRASSIGSCPVKLAAIALGRIEEHSHRTLKAFELGHEHELIVKDRLAREGARPICDQLEVSIPLKNGCTVRGHIDGILLGIPSIPKFGLENVVLGPCLLEVKSMYGPSYDLFLSSGLDEFKNYRDQVDLYTHYLNGYMSYSETGSGIKIAMACQCKEDLRLNIQIFDHDPSVVGRITEKTSLVMELINKSKNGEKLVCFESSKQKFPCLFEDLHEEDKNENKILELDEASDQGQQIINLLDRNRQLGTEIGNLCEEQKRIKSALEQFHKNSEHEKVRCGRYTIRTQNSPPAIDRTALKRDYPEIAKLEEQYKTQGTHMRIDYREKK
jgi:hypothetical protein